MSEDVKRIAEAHVANIREISTANNIEGFRNYPAEESIEWDYGSGPSWDYLQLAPVVRISGQIGGCGNVMNVRLGDTMQTAQMEYYGESKGWMTLPLNN